MKRNFDIAGIRFGWEAGRNFPAESWRKFQVETDGRKSDLAVTLFSEAESVCYGVQGYSWPGTSQIFRTEADVMLVSGDWSAGRILPLENPRNLQAFLIQMFYSTAVRRGLLQLHGALAAPEGRGLLFLGPSGIGKTTQAELWNCHRGAVIVNGDLVFAQEIGTGFLGWGTPWHGSSAYCENIGVPLWAMIVLKQAEHHAIRRLEGFEKVAAVSGSVFYPRWLDGGMELCLYLLDRLLGRIPVYELSCRPDEEAVRLTEEAVFGEYKSR